MGYLDIQIPMPLQLLQELRVAGLQVLKDDNWLAFIPHPNAFVLNIDDQLQSSDDEEAEDVGDTNMEGNNSKPFPGFGTSSGGVTSKADPSFQGASNLSNDEVLAHPMS
ncbi:hypothetical protein JCGZ_18384 [Jatropha curcas]|uniref:Isopenicillin N synthase-like Fe(2+) 2OG dioxygenase domain-containing protein n=1 Tax=Jatropha curcas TaxID=180498 RepID=A0A067KDX5_JATCU|nr:hypothetical protein JCGZ_18384 [Jatropha curcas]